MMLARRRMLSTIHRRSSSLCCRKLWLAQHQTSGRSYVSATSHGTVAMPQRRFECRNTLEFNARSLGGVRCVSGTRRDAAKVKLAHGARTETPAIPSFIKIRELASLLRVKPRALFKSLGGFQESKKHRIVLSGVPYAFPNLGTVVVPFQDAQAVAKVLGKEIRFLDIDKEPPRASLLAPSDDSQVSLCEEGTDGQRRRPVVVLLGHFNHGKTSILDALLGPNSAIAEREAGGITQEIRARTVSLDTTSGDKADATPSSRLATVATFLDTPGQEIFYRMRTNGARVADAVVLVVSAVDGVCLQTSESIGCAEELGLPAVVVLNKIDLLPAEAAAQRVKELAAEVREFVAIQDAKVLPLSARTGFGLDTLRTSLGAVLNQNTSPAEHLHPEKEYFEDSGLECAQKKRSSDLGTPAVRAEASVVPAGSEIAAALESEGDGAEEVEVVTADAPDGAATATVLDYTSSAKTGKVLLILVDRGVLRPGDAFVSGMLWGFVRSIYDEEGDKLLKHAGPGMAAKVVVVARTLVSNAPLGEPFRVLAKEAAEKVALVRALAHTISDFVDEFRLARDFTHVLDRKKDDDIQSCEGGEEADRPEPPPGQPDGADNDVCSSTASLKRNAVSLDRPVRRQDNDEEEDITPEDMPVTIVVKADSANTLASVLDALGDWGDVNNTEGMLQESFPEDASGRSVGDFFFGGMKGGENKAAEGMQRSQRQEGSERYLQHKQRRRLRVSVASSGVGAVTSSDVRLARDCECPVFAHNVKPDASATRELKRAGGGVVKAMPEETAVAIRMDVDVGIGGQQGFIGRGGEGRECIVVSETVGELLGEIERFVLRVM